MSDHEHMPEGEEAAPPGVRIMAVLRWLLVAAMAVVAGLSLARHYHVFEAGGTEQGPQFQCPMHPWVLQDGPGECPVCSMALVPVAQAAASTAKTAAEHTEHAEHDGYYCPMHPEVQSPDPEARCQKCGGMKLVPKPRDTQGQWLDLGSERAQRMGIRTAAVEQLTPAAELSAWGVVQAAEGSVVRLHARASGYVEQLFVKERAAQVRAGQPLLTLYSPELVAAQRELLTTERWAARGKEGAMAERDLSAAARDKLRTLGVSEADLTDIVREGVPRQALTLRAPRAGFVSDKPIVQGSYVEMGALLMELTDLSEVWVLADVNASLAARVPRGTEAQVSVPGEAVARTGEVSFVYPEVQLAQRTAQLRVRLSNRDLSLRPGTSVQTRFTLPAKPGLYVPDSAVLDTGASQYVFVSAAGGRFAQRSVQLGARAGELVEVLAGLQAGEQVVTSATFLLDAETRLRNVGQPAASASPPTAGSEK